MTIKELAEEIARAYDFKGKLVFDDTKSDGQYKKTASNAKLRKLLPDYQFVPISRGIKETVDWYKANYMTARN